MCNADQNDHHEDDWWDLVMQSRAQFQEALGDRKYPDVTAIIHEMRDERDFQILSNLFGEAEAREMTIGRRSSKK